MKKKTASSGMIPGKAVLNDIRSRVRICPDLSKPINTTG
jgi:hypothetical protein